MTMTPNDVSSASFSKARKGYDPNEVNAFLDEVAAALQQAQETATAMEARARVAVARLQELQSADVSVGATPEPTVDTAGATHPDAADPADDGGESVDMAATDEATVISRTLLLAQRTADATVAEAKQAAQAKLAEARQAVESQRSHAEQEAKHMIEQAKIEAQQARSAELESIQNAVDQLKARRDFLVGDVEQLEGFLVDQRSRLRSAAAEIESLCERVPDGLGKVMAPVLSPTDDADDADGGAPTAAVPVSDLLSSDEPLDETSEWNFEPRDEVAPQDDAQLTIISDDK